MNYQKLFFLTFIFIMLGNGCSMKQKSDQIDLQKQQPAIGSDEYKLNSILNEIKENCQAKETRDQNESIFVKSYDNYIKVDLNHKSDFRNGSYVLTKESKEKLSCISPILEEKKGVFIVITGHANDNKKKQQNQHLADNRAISLAELFFNAGIRYEIFAKGCSEKSSDTNDSINRKIYIYIYADRSNIVNHCQ